MPFSRNLPRVVWSATVQPRGMLGKKGSDQWLPARSDVATEFRPQYVSTGQGSLTTTPILIGPNDKDLINKCQLPWFLSSFPTENQWGTGACAPQSHGGLAVPGPLAEIPGHECHQASSLHSGQPSRPFCYKAASTSLAAFS